MTSARVSTQISPHGGRFFSDDKKGSSGIFGDLLREQNELRNKEKTQAAAAAAAAEAIQMEEPPPLSPPPPASPLGGGGGGDSSGGGSGGGGSASGSVGVGSGAASLRSGSECGPAPDGGVDLDLWEVLWGLDRVSDPEACSDALAENGVFSLEDVLETPNYRLGSFGVDPVSRIAIGKFVAENGGDEEFDEEFPDEELKGEEKEGGGAAASASGGESGEGAANSEGGGGNGEGAARDEAAAKREAEAAAEPLFDWNAMQANAPSYLDAFWGDLKKSAHELFSLDKAESKAHESVLTKKVHAAMPPTQKKKKTKMVKDEETGEEVEVEVEEEEPSDGGESAESKAEEEASRAQSELLVVVEGPSAWERVYTRLNRAPLFQELKRKAEEAASSEAGQSAAKAKAKLDDKMEDAREVWETSQNPIVYRLSEVWDSLTHETPTTLALNELRRLDPAFSLEEWRETMQNTHAPRLLSAWLRGDTVALRDWCSQDVCQRLNLDIAARKKERLIFDPNVLNIDHCEVVIHAESVERSAYLGLHVCAQQLKCVRHQDTGDVVEGGEDQIKASWYVMVFQRNYVEELGELQWKCVEFAPAGDTDQLF